MKLYSFWVPMAVLFMTVLSVACRVNGNKEKTGAINLEINKDKNIILNGQKIKLIIDSRMNVKFLYDSNDLSVNIQSDSVNPPHYLVSAAGDIKNFRLLYDSVVFRDINDRYGTGKQLAVTGIDSTTQVEKKLFISLYKDFSEAIIWHADYTNRSRTPLTLLTSVSNFFLLDASQTDKRFQPEQMWTYQGIAYDWGLDYIFPLKKGFNRDNYTGIQPISKMGGGVPLIDCWNPEMGLSIGHLAKKPVLLSMPTLVNPKGQTQVSIREPLYKTLAPGGKFSSIEAVVILHHLDFFNPLATYSSLMKRQGLAQIQPSPETYEPFWCGWGYESDFTLQDIYQTLPKLKELGLKWVVIDDRWFDKYGDWNPRKKLFPLGEKQLKQFVDSLHKLGFLAKIWWSPTLAQPQSPPPGGRWPSHDPGSSDLVHNHADWIVVDSTGRYPRCPRNMFFLNASLPAVQNYIKQLTHKFIADWGFDGHKLDAFWVIPPSYDSATKMQPERAYASVPDLIRIISETSKQIKPYSVTEICNCGTPQDFYQSLYIDQPVVADPTSFTQVRFRVKAFKALWGPRCPVFTDHVEHVATFTDPVIHEVEDSDKSSGDFASTIGTGGVPGTKFTWPNGFPKVTLTKEKELHWKKWLGIYTDKMLSKGDYLNLYDLAFDFPETHVIRKDNRFYYGIYNKNWQGNINLRGLGNSSYVVRDYANNRTLGTVQGPVAHLNIAVKGSLLLECIPVK